MTQELAPGSSSPFESIRRVNAAGNESWSSREFAKVLGYSDYRNFERVIENARTVCFNSGQRVDDHFVEITDMVPIGSGANRPVKTVMLSRYACYLAIQNADPGKEIVAAGQTYFATQTEEKLRRERTQGKAKANATHREVGAKVRKTIEELGGTMPENLPAAESIKKIETKQKRLGKQSDKNEEK